MSDIYFRMNRMFDLLRFKFTLRHVNILLHSPFSSCHILPLKSPSPHHSPPVSEILHLYSTAVWLKQPILLHCNLEEETPSLLHLCSLSPV